MYNKNTLQNGLRIVTFPMPGMQSVALGIWIKVGGRYEAEGDKGISHFLEHVLFKGSRRYSCRKLKESIEGVGGSLNGFTSEELTCYLVKIPGPHLSMALDILSDMVMHPLLAAEDVEKERTVIMEEIKMYRDLPQSYVHELLDELLWPGHPLGMTIAGTAESVGGISGRDLAGFKQRYYVPGNMVVSAAGAVEHEEFMRGIKKLFGSSRGSRAGAFLPARGKQRAPQMKLFRKETEQTHLALGFHGFRRDHPLKHAAGLLNIILGANMSSRLFNEVREKRGLAYEIGSQVKRFHDTGAFVVHAGLANDKLHDAVQLVLGELGKLKDKVVSDSELKRAKEFYAGQLALALEDTMDHMLWIGESTATLNRTHELKEVIRQMRRVEKADLMKVARRVFNEENLNLALVGPLRNEESELERLLHIE